MPSYNPGALATPAAPITTTPPFSDRSYTDLLTEVRHLLQRNAETLLAAGALFAQMLQHASAERIARDVDHTPAGVHRIAKVAEFWRQVRIRPAPNGRPARTPRSRGHGA